MKTSNVFKLSALIVVALAVFCSCQKKSFQNSYQFVNGTEKEVSVYIGKSVEIFQNTSFGTDTTIDLIFFSELFNDSSVVFGYNGKFYEERTLEGQSILNLSNHILTSAEDYHLNYIYFIAEYYILSLPEVEMPVR